MGLSRSGARLLRPVVLAAAWLPAGAIAGSMWQLTMIGEMYPAGQKVIHPTPAMPAYYLPLVMGYTEMGAPVAGVQPPQPLELVHHLATALASQGYLVTRQVKSAAGTMELSPPPTLLLVFHWGMVRPEKLYDGSSPAAAARPQVINKGQMLGLVAGKDLDAIFEINQETEAIYQETEYDRYFVMVSAYDFGAYRARHKLMRLWVAKLSMHAYDVTMDQALPALIDNGSAVFGRSTTGPKNAMVPAVPEGQVRVGAPTVVP